MTWLLSPHRLYNYYLPKWFTRYAKLILFLSIAVPNRSNNWSQTSRVLKAINATHHYRRGCYDIIRNGQSKSSWGHYTSQITLVERLNSQYLLHKWSYYIYLTSPLPDFQRPLHFAFSFKEGECHAGSMNETDKKQSKHLKNSVKCNTLDISITINYHWTMTGLSHHYYYFLK